MKKIQLNIAIISLMFFLSLNMESQSSFEVLISTNWNEMIADAEEDDSGNFYLVGRKNEPDSNENCGYIIKVNSTGEIIHENIYCISDTSFTFEKIIRINNSIIVIASKGSSETNNRNLCKLIFDMNLNIIKISEQSPLSGYSNISCQSLIYQDSHFILLCTAFPENDSQYPDIGFIELDENLDSIKCVVDHREYIQIGVDFLKNNDGSGYKVFGHGNYPGTFTSYDELIRFDSSFNFVSVDSIPWKIRNQISACRFDDSTYLLTGNKSVFNPTRDDVGIIKLNNSDQLLSTNHFGKVADTINHPAINNNVDFFNRNSIYLGGTSNFIPTHYPWQPEDSWIMLNYLDSNLNLNWQKFYGGDAFYLLWGLKATKDGGCLMYARRYDENTQFEEYDIYILKVDSNGLLTSTGDFPSIPVQQLAIFPNPSRDIISIRYPDIFGNDNKEIIIFNSLGNEVKHISATHNLTETRSDTSDLPVGLYFAVLKVGGQKVATGKFLIVR
jgi:hypothetical protein